MLSLTPTRRRPLTGAILAAALHIMFRYLDFDYHSAGIDAENQAQYQRAQDAVKRTQQTNTDQGGNYNQNPNYNSNNV